MYLHEVFVVDLRETCHMVQRAPAIQLQQSLNCGRETPTNIEIIERHFLELVMTQEGRK